MKQNNKITIAGMAMIVGCFAVIFGQVNASDSNDFNTTLDILNIAPVIQTVTQTTQGGSTITPNEGSTVPVKYELHVYDANGASQIVSANITMRSPNNVYTTVGSCVLSGQLSSLIENVTCTVLMPWFFNPVYDPNGQIDVATYDGIDTGTNNSVLTWSVNDLEAFTIAPSTITFGSIISGQTNVKGLQFLNINNTGNVDFTTGSGGHMSVKAQNLISGTNTFVAGNFTAKITDNCGGNSLIHDTEVTITNLDVSASVTGGEMPANLYLCIDSVPSIPVGSYVAPTAWTIYAYTA